MVADEERVRDALLADPTLIDDPDRAAGVIGNPLLRVPYMFCSDESADGPVLSCNRFDRGPDYYEITRTKLEDYWNYYLDNHFRRDSAFFSGNGALGRTFGTFFSVANSYKHWVYEVYQKSNRNQEQVVPLQARPAHAGLLDDGRARRRQPAPQRDVGASGRPVHVPQPPRPGRAGTSSARATTSTT